MQQPLRLGHYKPTRACRSLRGKGLLAVTWLDAANFWMSRPQASRFTVEDATRHMAFEMEILFRKMAPQPFPLGRRLEIVDLKGMNFRDIGSEWFAFAKTVRVAGPRRKVLSASDVLTAAPHSRWFSVKSHHLSPISYIARNARFL